MASPDLGEDTVLAEAEAEQDVNQTPVIVIGASEGNSSTEMSLPSFLSLNTEQDSHSTPSTLQETPPHDASSPSHDLSALCIASPALLLQPRQTEPQQATSDGPNYVKLIDDFNSALGKACKAGKALQDCCDTKQNKNPDVLHEPDSGCCEQELRNYRESCSELIQFEEHLKEAYEEEHKSLKDRLEGMEEKERASKMEHRLELDQMQQRHDEEVKGLMNTINMQAEHQALLNLQYHSAEVSELKKLKESYKAKQEEVERLRKTLADKEKSLYDLGHKIKTTERELQHQLLLKDEKYTSEQLERCREIGEMVSRLNSTKSGKEMNELVEEIFKETAKMKTSSQRSTSWRC